MKKLKYLFLLLVTLLIVPFGVFAEEEESTKVADSKEVIIYFFRGDGCPHCEEAEEWFKSIEGEYGDKFQVKDFETWYNEDNAELMNQIAVARGEEDDATGVPYILVGDQSWIGFTESYKSEILEKINTLYEVEPSNRPDALESVDVKARKKTKEEKKENDILTLVIILAGAGAIGYGIYFTRKKTNA